MCSLRFGRTVDLVRFLFSRPHAGFRLLQLEAAPEGAAQLQVAEGQEERDQLVVEKQEVVEERDQQEVKQQEVVEGQEERGQEVVEGVWTEVEPGELGRRLVAAALAWRPLLLQQAAGQAGRLRLDLVLPGEEQAGRLAADLAKLPDPQGAALSWLQLEGRLEETRRERLQLEGAAARLDLEREELEADLASQQTVEVSPSDSSLPSRDIRCRSHGSGGRAGSGSGGLAL